MESQWIITTTAVLGVFSVIGTGALLRRIGLVTAEADASLLRLAVRVLLPCLIFDKVVTSNAFRDTQGQVILGNILLPPVVGYLTVVVGILVAWGVARLGRQRLGLADPRAYCTFAACVGIFNYGFIPIPLISELFPADTLGVLFVYSQGVDLAIWTIGLLFISGAIETAWWKKLINPPSVTIVLALTFNLLNLGGLVPTFLAKAIQSLGEAAIPMSMLLIGATIAEQLMERCPRPTAAPSEVDPSEVDCSDNPPSDPTTQRSADPKAILFSRKALGTSAGSCLLRLALLPPLFILAALLMPASIELKRVMVVQAAMPSAVFPIVMARHFGGDPETALRTVLSNSVVSLVTIPLWIVWGMYLVGGGLP